MRPADLLAAGGARAGGAAGGAGLACGGCTCSRRILLTPPHPPTHDTHTLPPRRRYTAELKRPRTQSLAVKKAAVEELIDVLALDGCRNVRIGK